MNEETKDKEEVYTILGFPVVIDPTLKTPQEPIVFGTWLNYCESMQGFAQDTLDLLQKIRESAHLTDQEKRVIAIRMRNTVDLLLTRFANQAAEQIISTDSETPSLKRPGATISFHELPSFEQQHASCVYGGYLAHCGKPATAIQRITFTSGATEDRFYCSEHAEIERAIVDSFQPKPKDSETPSPASPAAP